jgi:hypothetical protein
VSDGPTLVGVIEHRRTNEQLARAFASTKKNAVQSTLNGIRLRLAIFTDGSPGTAM